GLMLSYLLRARNPLFNGNRQFYSQLCGQGFSFAHDVADDLRSLWVAHHLHQCGPGQRAHWIERDIAENLYPDLIAQVRCDRTTQARTDQRLRDLAATFRTRTIWLSQGDAVSFVVFDHS